MQNTKKHRTGCNIILLSFKTTTHYRSTMKTNIPAEDKEDYVLPSQMPSSQEDLFASPPRRSFGVLDAPLSLHVPGQ